MILFSYHALQRMQERKVSQEEVIDALENPDGLTPRKTTWIAKKRRHEKYLLLVIHKLMYTNYGIIRLVITIIITSKIRKYL